MPGYRPQEIEKKWQQFWQQNQTFRAQNHSDKPKYYVLDMFPYPSGAGLHVGHPLGYIASDIVSRYKRHRGFNVLHPMGFDSFGLPAEQYAIQTGQHPEKTTRENITRYIEQLSALGFSYDWSREIRTSNPDYYKWTQWIFLKLFNSWYNLDTNKAESIRTLQEKFAAEGSKGVRAVCDEEEVHDFSAGQWQMMTEAQKIAAVHPYRLAYQSETYVNWCAGLGTVLSNDEVKDGVSERGGFPVERRLMPQWNLRITAYAQRLLDGLDHLDWPDAVKEMQRNWIGRSVGAEVRFEVENHPELPLTVFTTRPDTLFGVSYMAVAPESELIDVLTTPAQREAVSKYVEYAKNRSERDRMADVKTITGEFTGAYALHPFSGEKLPIWVADYVLAGYGTGVVMAVPAHDTRDFAFARHFSLPIIPVVEGFDEEAGEAYVAKEGRIVNSDFLNGLDVKPAIQEVIKRLEEKGIGKGKINYRLRDAIFGRQRYWGEPIPIYYRDGMAFGVAEQDLPLVLPEIDEYKPTETGEPPLGRAQDWKYRNEFEFELSTMPGWAGSSWYYLRYMDPKNEDRFVGEEAERYWQNVDLYMGGAEHATGHLLYSRFWHLFLKDYGLVTTEEPFQKLINQGMILGRSNFVYRINGTNTFVTLGKKDQYDTTPLHVDISIVENDVLDTEAFRRWRPDYANAEFILEDDGRYVCGWEVEKMSKNRFNVATPDDLVERFGADVLRLHEMFLGPLEQYKPWNTQGMTGVLSFLRKLWRLYFPEDRDWAVTDEAPTPAELKALHKAIRKAQEDIERFSFNTSVSTFMICVNELSALNCRKRAILEPLTVLISPYAPHLAEELWEALGHPVGSLSTAPFPEFEEKYLVEDTVNYPIAINGKVREQMQFAADASAADIEAAVRATDILARFAEGKPAKKVIVVPGRMVNVVV
ncbi:leucine--tRNA ligase [Hymenobacter busanensis]|uniref:Leucine--tRNA ligase n=1 Tax=Hymenobacter busanensis TaxID=2607656 RepID=A0A7L4ZXW7_9BACT|nr:leucine--tRNA ligase [Hymenobacter busanensis]KAA9325880.1 leucine--tRNA ligase [Hymenobacter busanensis]QHJ06280.1 leucine--tRNA ligase [Hymenobacter busanensis]